MTCRGCGATLPEPFLDFGDQPLANGLLDAPGDAPRYPLRVRVCGECWLVQTDQVLDPAAVFDDYPYFTSVSSSAVAHAKAYVEMVTKRLGLGKHSRVLEIASNDGYLLRHFDGPEVLGIEPAANVAVVADVPTLVGWWPEVEVEPADLIVANNVLAHVPDLHGFIAGIAWALKPEGVATFEFPWLVSLLESGAWDTMYHEHLCHFSLTALRPLLDAHHLRIFDAEILSTHGGSLRLWVCRQDSWNLATRRLWPVLYAEADAGPETDRIGPKACAGLAEHVAWSIKALSDLDVRYGYGAAAKATMLCNVADLHLEWIADASPAKQGKFVPVVNTPIVSPDALAGIDEPVLCCAWNLLDELRGLYPATRWVVPIPEVKVL